MLDLSLESNRAAVERALDAGAWVRYFDHHAADPLPHHPRLQAHIDPDADQCTSLIVDRYCDGRFSRWAVAAAYGDNLHPSAETLAAQLGLGLEQRKTLKLLGEAVNYNAYGQSEADVLIAPRRLYPVLARYRDPLDLVAHEPVIGALDRQRRADLQRAFAVPPLATAAGPVVVLPAQPWCRRVLGTFANVLAQREPDRAHAVALRRDDAHFVISVRAPLDSPAGADTVCRRFGGGGRRAAAAIDPLPAAALDAFLAEFANADWSRNGSKRCVPDPTH